MGITLYFSSNEQLTGGNMTVIGIYAFLLTLMVTGFPLIIQEYIFFVLSREGIIFNNKWNQGILHCAPLYFCSTFHTMISGNAPLSSKTWAFRCLPFEISCYPHLTQLRDAVQTYLKVKDVVLCTNQCTIY